MDHAVLVEVVDGGGDALHDGLGLALGEELLPEDLVEEFAAPHEVEHEEDLVRGLEEVPQGDDVRMLAVAEEDLDLLGAIPLVLGDDLDGVLGARGTVDAALAHGETAGADLFQDLVLLVDGDRLDTGRGATLKKKQKMKLCKSSQS